MTAETDLTRLSPLIERLVDEADARARERLLVDAIAEFDEAPAIAVWHESGSQWRATLERGEAQDLPSADEVEAIAAGSLSSLAADRHVLVAGRPASRIALALGGARLEEDLLDLLEALLVTTAELEAAADRLLDKLVAPFPSQVEASTEDRRWTHDLRNLLMSIRTTQDLLEMPGVTLDDDERLHFGEVLEHECQRAGDLLIDSLEGRRPGSRPPQAKPACRAPREVIADVCADVCADEEAALRLAGLEIVFVALPSAAGRNCPLSELALARVVHNLVCNARAALIRSCDGTPHAVTQPATIAVTLSGTESGNALQIVVENEGPGVPPAHLAKLFQQGFTAYKQGGSGQGLALVHDLVTEVGGRVAVENRPAGGVRFSVTLPSS